MIPYELAHRVDIPPSDLVPWWATPFTSMFMHGGWLHLIFNMLYLWIFGNNVEDLLGRARFVAFYLLCGLVAAFVAGARRRRLDDAGDRRQRRRGRRPRRLHRASGRGPA